MIQSLRKKKLINLQLQLKLVGTFTVISCFAALAQVVLLSQSMIALSDDLGEAADSFRSRLPEVLASDIGWTLGFLVPFMILVGVHITHKVAGPIYRIDCYLGEVTATGRLDRPCKVRDGDEMQSLVTSINAAFARLVADRDGVDTSLESDEAVAAQIDDHEDDDLADDETEQRDAA